MQFYATNTQYKVSGTNTKAPVEPGQLRSFSNPLGTFNAKWSTDANGNAVFAGYKNDKGQTFQEAVKALQEVTSGWKGALVNFGNYLKGEHDKDPVGFNLSVTMSLLSASVMTAAEPGPYSPGHNPSVTTLDDMSALGTLKFRYVPETPLLQQEVAGVLIPLPDPAAIGYPHTTLGGKMSETGVRYRQSATFEGSWPLANGETVPNSRVDWYHHGRPFDHRNPHQHPFYWGGSHWLQEKGPGYPFP